MRALEGMRPMTKTLTPTLSRERERGFPVQHV
jgi:hypothetical protein